MTAPHRATPEDWLSTETMAAADSGNGYYALRCILELRDRLTAAEQRISELEGNSSAGLTGSNHLEPPDGSAPAVTRRPLREPSATTIAECGGPCDQGFWHCDCGLLEKLNPELHLTPAAPIGSLVEVVAMRMSDDDCPPIDDARAAILAVAAWLDTKGQHGCSLWLREEVERG